MILFLNIVFEIRFVYAQAYILIYYTKFYSTLRATEKRQIVVSRIPKKNRDTPIQRVNKINVISRMYPNCFITTK